jgi:hypothetical protein
MAEETPRASPRPAGSYLGGTGDVRPVVRALVSKVIVGQRRELHVPSC